MAGGAPANHDQSSAPERPGHRERLIDALAESIRERGYHATTVADVVRLARTSRRSFYEQFADRDACFLALFDATNEAMMRSIADAAKADRPVAEQVYGAVDAYIGHVVAQPELYRSFVRELPALGHAGGERALSMLEQLAQMFVALVERGRRAQPDLGLEPLDMDTAIIVVGGLRELAVISLQRRRDLHELRAAAGATIMAILVRGRR
ncbi:MAG: TetR/AcrR family transcriptional regulator [Solirubrobacteraceae bacterium]